jgi:transposase
MVGRHRTALVLTPAEQEALEGWSRRQFTPQALALRAKIILACSEGRSNVDIAGQLGVSRDTVGKWRSRFLAERLVGLQDGPRPGAPRRIPDKQIGEVIRRTLEIPGPGTGQAWSTRSMAAVMGMSQSTVSRIWRAHGLQPQPGHDPQQPDGSLRAAISPWRTEPPLAAHVVDIAGLFLYPPAKCLALSAHAAVTERPTGPLPPGAQTPDSRRRRRPRRRHHEFLRFLSLVEDAVPVGCDVHLICDRRTPYTALAVRDWLHAQQRYRVHVIPAAANWLSTFEWWFAELARGRAGRLPAGSPAAPQPVAWIAAASR